jgi:phosphatidate cytidylyltransferase
LSARVKTALVAGPICLALLFFGGPVLFGLFVAAVAVVGVNEYGKMACRTANPLEGAFLAGWGGVLVLSFLSTSYALPSALLVLGALVYLAGWIFGCGPEEDTLGRWGVALGGWILVAYFLGHALWIRRYGVCPVVYVLAVVWAGDTAAYYVGTALGSHALAPSVSPKKSVEGAVASLIAGALAAGVVGLLLPLPHSVGASVALGLVLNAAAQLGDLAESLFKRCAGIKDSGDVFPGHGGVLDRIDGFLFVVPIYAAFLATSGV